MIYYYIPKWFAGFDIAMEILFSLAAILVAFTAYKIYYISKEKKIMQFGTGFLLMALSYILWAIMNIYIFLELKNGIDIFELPHLQLASLVGLYSHMILFLIGLSILTFVTLKVNKTQIFLLISGMSLITLATCMNKIISFRIVCVFLLLFITYNYYIEYKSNKKTYLVLIAFLLLLFSNITFTFSNTTYPAYVLGHILEFIAYVTVLISLVRTLKK